MGGDYMTQHEAYSQFAKYTKQQLIHMLASETAIQIRTASDVYSPIMDRLEKYRYKEQEHFFCITLNSAHEVINIHLVSVGLLNRTLVHPREVFKHAIKDNSAAIIIGHNHPSGSLDPSTEDKDITRRMKIAGEILGIKVLDHIIVSPTKGYLSMLEMNLL
jgi:DNA repair protein RadC